MSNLWSSLARMKMSKMSMLGRPCNKLHAVSFVAAHSTRDVKQNVQDLPSLTHSYGKKQELPEPPQSPDQGAFPECCVQTCMV